MIDDFFNCNVGTIISSVSQWTSSLLRNEAVAVSIIGICGCAMTVETLGKQSPLVVADHPLVDLTFLLSVDKELGKNVFVSQLECHTPAGRTREGGFVHHDYTETA